MKLLKRQKEVLAGLLECGAETPEALAELFAAKLDQLRGERIYQFALVRIAGIVTVAGIYTTGNQARKAIEKAPGDRGWIVSGRTAEGWAQHLVDIDKPAPISKDFALVKEDALKHKAKRGGW